MTSDGTAQPLRLAFVVTELSLGGAELMLWKLLSRIDRRRFEPRVFGLSARTDHTIDLFARIGVPCEVIGMQADARALAGLLRLAGRLRATRPHIVQGWLYHGNVAATLAVRLARCRSPVLWNIRGAPIPGDKARSRAVTWLGAKLGRLPVRIVYNSTVSAAEHERMGYPSSKRLVVPNGFDTEAFRPSDVARAEMRSTLGLDKDALLVGLFARYHAVKDHENFLRAAALVSAAEPAVHFILAGEDVDASNRKLHDLIARLGLSDRAHLLGLRDDMPHLTAALDISVSSSFVEGFPNVIGEAMSCAVPCVVTDVGDSAWVVGETGRSVRPRDAGALAAAILGVLAMKDADRTTLGRRARQRIVEHFSLPAVVGRYEALYDETHRHAHTSQA